MSAIVGYGFEIVGGTVLGEPVDEIAGDLEYEDRFQAFSENLEVKQTQPEYGEGQRTFLLVKASVSEAGGGSGRVDDSAVSIDVAAIDPDEAFQLLEGAADHLEISDPGPVAWWLLHRFTW